MLRTTALSDTTCGDSTWRRLNASSCWVSPAARSAAAAIASACRAQRLVGRHLLEQPAGLPANHHEQVVEVVRDAAREPADRLHLLRLAELLLELLVGGQIVELTADGGELTAVAEQPGGADEHVDRPAVAATERDLVLTHAAIARDAADEAAPAHVAAEDRHRAALDRLADLVAAQHAGEGGIAVGERAVDGRHEVAGEVGVEELTRLAHETPVLDRQRGATCEILRGREIGRIERRRPIGSRPRA